MGKLNKYQIIRREKLKKEVIRLYKEGWSLREIGTYIKRSHEWVRLAIKESYQQGKIDS